MTAGREDDDRYIEPPQLVLVSDEVMSEYKRGWDMAETRQDEGGRHRALGTEANRNAHWIVRPRRSG